MNDFMSFDKVAAGDHWDLQDIVKGQATGNNNNNNNNMNVFNMPVIPSYDYACLDQERATLLNELEQLCKPSIDQPKQKIIPDACSYANTPVVAPKRRKNKHKMTFFQQASSDRVMSDKWNWRKYGEKVIKGSPYPRSYYRCSNAGGCLARKQVEQSTSDPGIFLITYIDDHSHPYPTRRPSQAGRSSKRFDASTKALTSGQSVVMASRTKPSASSVAKDKVLVHMGDANNNRSVECVGGVYNASNGVFEDDFFAGLEYLEGLERT